MFCFIDLQDFIYCQLNSYSYKNSKNKQKYIFSLGHPTNFVSIIHYSNVNLDYENLPQKETVMMNLNFSVKYITNISNVHIFFKMNCT